MTPSDEYEYTTRDDVNIAILRAMERMRFRERLRQIILLVTKQLVAAGVDFSKVDFSKVRDVTDDEIGGIWEDL